MSGKKTLIIMAVCLALFVVALVIDQVLLGVASGMAFVAVPLWYLFSKIIAKGKAVKENREEEIKPKSKEDKPSREEILARNENQPFDSTILDDRQKYDEYLAYDYTNVACDIIGNIEGMKEGAVLYLRKDGFCANAIKENVLQIQNKKLVAMVNDFYDKDAFSTIRARFVSADENKAFINMGFFKSNIVDEDEEDEGEEDDE